MEFLSQTYVALRGPTGAPQTPADTIERLSDRLSPSTLLADRRAAVLALKGLSREWKRDVGNRALPGLLEVLYNDAEIDAEIGKAALETLLILCSVEEEGDLQSKDVAFKHTDYVLANETTTYSLFSLLGEINFYTRFLVLQYLSLLLQHRRQIVQVYFLKTSGASTRVISALEDRREIIRNETLTMVQALISQNSEIQKVLVFEGAFEKLFNIITQEGGVDGGVVTRGALTCVDGLLRFNSSNQGYFRETAFQPLLCSFLLFPTSLGPHDPVPQEFALQFWGPGKKENANALLGIIGILVGYKGGSENPIFSRCLVEMALASNAPSPLKTQALRLLPANLNFPLVTQTLTPYIPVPETYGEEWDRLEPATVLDVLIELAIHGEYNGLEGGNRTRDGLELRTTAVAALNNLSRAEETRLTIVQAMIHPEVAVSTTPAYTPLLNGLALSFDNTSPIDPDIATSTHLATLIFSHVLRSSPHIKSIARSVRPPTLSAASHRYSQSGTLFIPADEAPPSKNNDADEDAPQTILQILTENLSLALLSRSRINESDRESREWDRVVVGYLCLLSQWLWEDPPSVREFLDAGGFGVLVKPANQMLETDIAIPSLCAFLLGICYEFNREPGEITRATIYPIISRLGVETLIGRMTLLREDERFKAVGPDSILFPHPATPQFQPQSNTSVEWEIWFDWAFVDFWKSNYYAIQKGFSTEPDQLIYSSDHTTGSAVLVASLRNITQNQVEEIGQLKRQVHDLTSQSEQEEELSSLLRRLEASENRQKELEKEQEDLLVLLDEVSTKRKKDKERLRVLDQDVSEDEES